MLPRKNRLSGYQIPYVLEQGKRTHGTVASLIVAKHKEAETPTQFTTIVPVKLSKRAVKRNRTRRLLTEAVHTLLHEVKPGFLVIVMGKKILETEKLTDIQSDITKTLGRAQLLDR